MKGISCQTHYRTSAEEESPTWIENERNNTDRRPGSDLVRSRGAVVRSCGAKEGYKSCPKQLNHAP